MSKISLRWRITLLMGVLVLISTILLTTLSIHNMLNSFVTPLLHSSEHINETMVGGEDKSNKSFPITDNSTSLPEGVTYEPEIKLDIENAKQTFSTSSYLYMALVIVGGMFAAYQLAGRAMRPISKFNDEIGSIDGNNLSNRIIIPETKDEIENLSHSFNKLLERLELAFEKEKRFSANVAHELKTPLATIMTSAQVLQLNDQITPEEYSEYLDTTLQSTKRLSAVVDGLLMLNRANWDISFESISITQMICDIKREIESHYAEKNITLKCDLNAVALKGSPLLLYRGFFNLIENAYKYTEKDGSITITACTTEHKTIIRIADTGIGISKDHINNIFEPFYRADKSRSRKIAGAGLGLSIAKEIFDLHKAAITISSEPELGTVIEVEFANEQSLIKTEI